MPYSYQDVDYCGRSCTALHAAVAWDCREVVTLLFLGLKGPKIGRSRLKCGLCRNHVRVSKKKGEGVKVSNPSVGTAKNVPCVCGNPRFRVQGLAVCQG